MRTAVRYRGHVQGVGFRATARRIAADFAVTGWVRNEPDGAVQMEVQGDPAAVAAVAQAIRDALDLLIQSEDSIPIPEIPGENGFVIRR